MRRGTVKYDNYYNYGNFQSGNVFRQSAKSRRRTFASRLKRDPVSKTTIMAELTAVERFLLLPQLILCVFYDVLCRIRLGIMLLFNCKSSQCIKVAFCSWLWRFCYLQRLEFLLTLQQNCGCFLALKTFNSSIEMTWTVSKNANYKTWLYLECFLRNKVPLFQVKNLGLNLKQTSGWMTKKLL